MNKPPARRPRVRRMPTPNTDRDRGPKARELAITRRAQRRAKKQGDR